MFTKSSLPAENSTFFSGKDTDKNVPLRMHQNTPIQVKNLFLWGGAYRFSGGKGYPSPHLTPTKPSGSTLRLPRIPARFTPLIVYIIIIITINHQVPDASCNNSLGLFHFQAGHSNN